MSGPDQPAFRALADPTRREILRMLKMREMTIAEVAEPFDMTRAAVKKHLTVLAQGGMIRTRMQGREVFNIIDPEGFRPVADWLTYFETFWDARLANLKAAIEEEEHTP